MKKTMRTVVLAAFAVMMFVLASGIQAQPQDQGGQGGGGRRGNFDPAQMMDRMLTRVKDNLKATDEEWTVIKPLLTDVMTKSMGNRGGRGMMFGGRGTRGGQGGQDQQGGQQRPPRGGMGQNPEAEALNAALDNESTPASDIQAKLTAYRDAQKKREADLKDARDKLRKVLTLRQEARLVLDGMLD